MTDNSYHLVHANLAQARAPLDDPLMAGFTDHLDEIDALAQSSPGFIAQPDLPDEGQVYSSNLLLNVSIWETVEDLEAFTYDSRHKSFLDQREMWFHRRDYPAYVLYWAPATEIVTELEIHRRFQRLNEEGPTLQAFTFIKRFSLAEWLASRAASQR